jgi:ATP-dependent RNA helicase DDX5/DBP2
MLDMGFEPQIREVMLNLPKPHQTLLFSATMPVEVETLAADYLNMPVKIKVGAVSVPTANVSQHLEKLVDAQKVDRLCELLLEEKAEAEKFGGTLPMTIVFVERKARADEIMELLNAEGVTAAAFHGGRSQGEREAALEDYKTGRCSVLVATDVAARGLDVKGIAHVINLDLPRAFEDYVHRVGRTGRAGMTGRSTSFYTDRDSYIVAQIKRALQELEAGNAFAFATGKEARAKEREAAKAWREGRVADDDPEEVGGVVINVDEKFKHMQIGKTASAASLGGAAAKEAPKAGLADDAFGSDDDDDDGW